MLHIDRSLMAVVTSVAIWFSSAACLYSVCKFTLADVGELGTAGRCQTTAEGAGCLRGHLYTVWSAV